ncbi:MAG TPA: chemotaxis protein CheB [Thermoanaerobaculia bacterium]|nr:chemotaxis protein CheB [Thermoanaerobaculia bacterium]
MPGHDIIVIGASAGGVEALLQIVSALPADLPAVVLTALHLGAGPSALPEILTRAGRLPAGHPVHGEPLRRGRIYVAPPDRHLLLHDGRLRIERGAKENGHRPAIDVLFRSAAQAYGPRVVGVVLTGNLDDGTAGLLAIQEQGGIAVVQDPDEADYPGMPRNACENVKVDHVLPLAQIAPLLVQLAEDPVAAEPVGGTPGGERSSAVAEELLGESGQDLAGDPSGFTCPDCGGALWETHDHPLVRYRCRTGHVYSPESLITEQSEGVETALWTALRVLQENADLARRMARRMRDRGLARAEARYAERAEEAERQAVTLRVLLLTAETMDEEPTPVEAS